MKIDLHQVDAFSATPFRGNPAAVVTNADGLTDEDMQNIASEMNLAETAFVFKPTNKKAGIRVRYVTSKKIEIPFVGHATIGTLYELARLNLYGLGRHGRNEILLETKAGILTMWTDVSKSSIEVIMGVPPIKLADFRLQGAAFSRAFGVPTQALVRGKKVQIDTNLKYVYIPITSLSVLGSLKFKFSHISKSFTGEDITLFCAYTPEGFDSDSALHSRVVAPLIGFTEEDSFTGSTQAVVCAAAREQGLLDSTINEYKVEQGDFVDRPGRATVVFDPSQSEPLVKATAAHVFSTTINT